MATPPAPSAPPSSAFGVPGVTQWTEQKERTQGLVTTLSQANEVQAIGIQEFLDTDIVFGWDAPLTIAQTVTAGTGETITQSDFFPWNWLSRITLKVQQQYDLIDLSGKMAAIIQSYRPSPPSIGHQRNALTANPAGNWPNSAFPQASLQTPPALTDASTSIPLHFELPASMYFDRYWDLDQAGTPLAPPSRAIVSPQYMAGTVRNVQLALKYAAGFGPGLDKSPYNTTTSGTTASTITGTSTLDLRRRGIYAPAAGATPPLYAWQYQRTSEELGVRASNFWPISVNGQILSVVGLIWDPSANGGLGAPVDLSNIETLNLRYGSKLLRYEDSARSMQYRFLQQHGFLPPVGTFIWDLALTSSGSVTNEYALNTLSTSGITVECKFAAGSAPSAETYVELGVEALTYVSPAATSAAPQPVG